MVLVLLEKEWVLVELAVVEEKEQLLVLQLSQHGNRL